MFESGWNRVKILPRPYCQFEYLSEVILYVCDFSFKYFEYLCFKFKELLEISVTRFT